MKRLISFLCVLAMLLTLLPVAAFAAEGESVDFVVLSTTDMHGKCWDKNVLTDGNENNNMLRVSTAVQGYRETYGENLLLIDNGDTYQGTPVSTVQLGKITSGESDLPAAMALCLGDIGYDVSVLGNHEFNYPWSTMSGIYAYLETRGVPIITANLYYDGSDGVHERGENVFTPYLIKTVTVNGNTHKIGVLGFENTDCTRWDVPDNYPGIVFAHPDNTQMSMAWEAQRYIPQMQAEGCEFIIVSYHSGTGSASGELVFGKNTEGQVTRLINECEGIDMVIAGHDHSSSYSNSYINDKNGKPVLVVNGGGQQLTQSIFTFTEEGGKLAYTVKESKNLNLANYTSDAALKAKIEPYAAMAVEYVNQSAGTAVGTWDTSHNYYLEQTDTIDLINHVQMTYGSKYMAKKYDTDEKKAELYAATGLDHIEVDISAASPVTSNNYYVKPGEITMKTIVQMYKYDNNVLYLLPLTGKQIKDIMEQNASTRLKATVKNGAVSYTAIGDNFTNVVFGGINFVYDMYQPEGSRVVISGLSNGKAFELDKTYVVACNSYHLGNTGCGFGAYTPSDSIWNQNDDLAGANIQEAILEYIQDKGEISTEPFTWTWKLDYTGDLNAPTTLEGDLVAQKTDTLENGDEIVIYYDAEATVIGTKPAADDRRLDAVNTTSYQDYIAFSSDAAVFTVEKVEGENDPFRLKNEKGYLVAGQNGSSLGFAEEASDLAEWYLVPVEGGFHIMNVGANYGGDHNQAIEWYKGFTTYGVKDTAIYLFNLYKLVDAAKRVDELTDGRQYVIYLDSEGLSVGTEENSGGLAAVKNTASGDFMLLPLTEGTLVATAELGEDGKVAFVSEDGKYLSSKPTGNGIYLADEPAADELSLWQLVPVDGGFHVMSVGANYNGTYNQALEYYNGKFTTYGVKDTDIYLFNLYELPEQKAEDETFVIPNIRADVMYLCWWLNGCPAPQSTEHPYTDLDPEDPYYDAMIWTYETGITSGTTQTLFSPDMPCTKAQIITFLWRAMGKPAPTAAYSPFSDVKEGSFYYESTLWASEQDWIDLAVEDYKFSPNSTDYHVRAAKESGKLSLAFEKHSLDEEVLTPPTCTEPGEVIGTCTVCGFELHDPRDALGHNWGEPTYEWAEDYSTCTATSVCQNDPTHIRTETSTATAEMTQAPTASSEGVMTYTAVFENGTENVYFETQTITVAIPKSVFEDVKAGTYYYDAVLWAVENGITNGTDTTHFSPNNKCTRAQVVTFLWRASGSPTPSALQSAGGAGNETASRVVRAGDDSFTLELAVQPAAIKTYGEDNVLAVATVSPCSVLKWYVCDAKGNIYYQNAVENVNGGDISITWTGLNQNGTHPAGKVDFSLVLVATDPDGSEHVANGYFSYDFGDVCPFTDVAQGTYYYEAVLWAVEKGITSGTAKDKFSPNAPCTRGQVVTFLWRAQGEPEPAASNPFTDVSDSAYYYKAVLWAVENEVTNGKTPTTFGPADTCTRGQIVTFLYRALAGIGNS